MRIATVGGKFYIFALLVFLFTTTLFAQDPEITVTEIVGPDEIVIFYLTDFDFNNASNSPLIFQYTLNSNVFPQKNVVMELQMTASVPSLGLNNEQIIYAKTDPFTLNAGITISNRDIDLNIDEIYDLEGNAVVFGVAKTETPDIDTQRGLIDAITQAGKLPDGVYVFDFTIESLDGTPVNNVGQRIITISNPTSPGLISPGGDISEGIIISTQLPFFEWEYQGCEYFIRVSEYDAALHSSPEEGLNDLSSLPFPDDGGYYPSPDDPGEGYGLQNGTLLYPLDGAKPLEPGKTYAWAVKKMCRTTGGFEPMFSNIYTFTVQSEVTAVDPAIMALKSLLGDAFDALFTGEGELAGYNKVVSVLLNGEAATASAVSDVAGKRLSGEITQMSIEIE